MRATVAAGHDRVPFCLLAQPKRHTIMRIGPRYGGRGLDDG